jgi:hypothetical protein
VNFATFALRDLLGNSAAVDLDLELELTESGTRSTVILQPCSVAEELIDADSFSPTRGYPSYIFQALTAAATNPTTSLVAITGLNWTAQANSEYLAEWGLLATPTDDVEELYGQIFIPSGSSLYGNWIKFVPASGLFPTNTPLTDLEEMASTSQQTSIIQKAYIKTGITQGTVEFKYAKATAVTGSMQVDVGSWVRVEKVK